MQNLLTLALATSLLAALPGCGPPGAPAPADGRGQALDPAPTVAGELRDNRSVYAQDDLTVVPVIRLTVTDLDGLGDVDDDVPGAEVAVLFQEGGFGAGLDDPNGMLSLRGETGRASPQKSYKIVFDDGSDRWKGQKRVHLLKNQYDLTRARNYLAFEYFKTVRHITSMRHQFVRVYLNGDDLGLYEWFEHSGSGFLQGHGLDPDGSLYKVQNFSYRPYSDTLFDCDDPALHCLEKEENHDPDKVHRMLDAVNDLSRDINDVIDTHFQRDNYETWLATAILFSDYDSASQNYFLYSPHDSERWYLLPWDLNGGFDYFGQPSRRDRERPRTSVAPGYWWQINLHKRYLSDPANVASLKRRIDGLRASTILDSKTRRILATVHDTVRPYIGRDPDLHRLPVSDASRTPAQKVAEWEGEWTRLGTLMSRTQRDFETTVEWPTPTWLGTPRVLSGGLTRFRWDPSLDLQGDGVTYDLLVARSPRFEGFEMVFERSGLTSPTYDTSRSLAGTYYMKVIARDTDDPDAHWQLTYSRFTDEDGVPYYGVKEFTLP